MSLSKILNTKITPKFPFEWSYKKDLVYLYSTMPEVFNIISWASDTQHVKLKEKDELETIMNQINMSRPFIKQDIGDICVKEEPRPIDVDKPLITNFGCERQLTFDFYVDSSVEVC